MQQFRRLFAFLFILSFFVGIIHEVNHNYSDGETCSICIIAHSPGLLDNTPALVFIDHYYTPFMAANSTFSFAHYTPIRSRSPPLA